MVLAGGTTPWHLDIMAEDKLTLFLEAGSSLGTVIAAGFAAWSAFISRASAVAAEQAVAEARAARRAELSPRIVLERRFLDMQFSWHRDRVDEAYFRSRDDATPFLDQIPTFNLSNYGPAPALEPEIIFELEDPNGPYEMPERFAALGLSVNSVPGFSNAGRDIQTLQYGPNGPGIPLYRVWPTSFPHCAPGQTREIEFPKHLLTVLLLRGLQGWERRATDNPLEDIILIVRIKYHTVEEEPGETQFRFRASPFWQGESDPLLIYCHFHELPMFSKSGQRAE